MKKLLCIVVCLLFALPVLLCGCQMAGAEAVPEPLPTLPLENLVHAPENTENAAEYEIGGFVGSIVSFINYSNANIQSFVNNAEVYVTEEDIDFADAVKVYSGNSICKIETNNLNEIKQILANGKYSWVLCVRKRGKTYVFRFEIAPPLNSKRWFLLTKEERESLQSKAGKWDIVSMEVHDRIVDFYEIAQHESERETDDIVFAGFTYVHYPVALIADDAGEVTDFVPVFYEPVSTLEAVFPPEILEAKDEMRTGNVFDYEKMKAALNGLEAADNFRTAVKWGARAFIVLIAAAECMIIVRKKRKQAMRLEGV